MSDSSSSTLVSEIYSFPYGPAVRKLNAWRGTCGVNKKCVHLFVHRSNVRAKIDSTFQKWKAEWIMTQHSSPISFNLSVRGAGDIWFWSWSEAWMKSVWKPLVNCVQSLLSRRMATGTVFKTALLNTLAFPSPIRLLLILLLITNHSKQHRWFVHFGSSWLWKFVHCI